MEAHMIEATITVVGNVATEPKLGNTSNGTAYTHFRLAANGSRFDKRSRRWVNDDASYYTVFCWRAPLADNVSDSLEVGDPIYVHGRMRVKEWTDDKEVRHWLAEIDARAIGHDLFRGTSKFTRPEKDETSLKAEDEAIAKTRDEYLRNSSPGGDADPKPDGDGTVDLRTGEILNSAA
jgi:single stranded DNA-binding protein